MVFFGGNHRCSRMRRNWCKLQTATQEASWQAEQGHISAFSETKQIYQIYRGSINRGPPKSSLFIGPSLKNQPFGDPPFMEIPISNHTQS